MYFIFLSFYSTSVSIILTISAILDSFWTAPQCLPGIFPWWIIVFFSSTMLSMLTLSSMLFFVYGIETGNETGSAYDVLVYSLALCETIIYRLKCSHGIPLTNAFFLVIIEA